MVLCIYRSNVTHKFEKHRYLSGVKIVGLECQPNTVAKSNVMDRSEQGKEATLPPQALQEDSVAKWSPSEIIS